ncbi:MAG TPA: hypothetical protein VJ719_07335 [Chthoniobacterales bacterium]|nr:hypothetical protein [Chthoniobacterales bacterium]
MKRMWLVIVSVLVVLAILYAVRLAERRASMGVASLLPRTTVAFAHLPDFRSSLEDWHRSDLYQIYREPAVQDFLKHPLQSPKPGGIAVRVQEFQDLEPTNAFVAVTSIANDKPKLVAGFEYHCNQDVADRVIGNWRTKINPSAKREQLEYQNHQIELFRQSTYSLALVRDNNWFFASNDPDELKAILDRADGRNKDRNTSLVSDESYEDAMDAMPGSFAFLVYFQPKALADRLAAVRQSLGQRDKDVILQQIRSVCLTTRFNRGKLHDVLFVGMPKQEQGGELTRNSLGLATRATILYATSIVDFSRPAGLLFPTGDANSLGPAAQKISNALAAAGITPADWEAAFASEISLLSDWPEQARWPSFLITAAVKDTARARKIVDALTNGTGPNEQWQQTDRDGVHYWSLLSSSGWLSVKPVMALSDRTWIAGLDMESVGAAMARAAKPESGLADTEPFHKAESLVPTPTKFFAYVDPAQIYSRVDAAIRPFLFMGAMFSPAANNVDLAKVPPPEAITKHLGPIVASQRYAGNGYIAESVGPLTLNQAGIGVAVLGAMGAMTYHRMNPMSGLKGLVPTPATQAPAGGTPASRPTPLLSPAPTP